MVVKAVFIALHEQLHARVGITFVSDLGAQPWLGGIAVVITARNPNSKWDLLCCHGNKLTSRIWSNWCRGCTIIVNSNAPSLALRNLHPQKHQIDFMWSGISTCYTIILVLTTVCYSGSCNAFPPSSCLYLVCVLCSWQVFRYSLIFPCFSLCV